MRIFLTLLITVSLPDKQQSRRAGIGLEKSIAFNAATRNVFVQDPSGFKN
jgi:hypothetical protein